MKIEDVTDTLTGTPVEQLDELQRFAIAVGDRRYSVIVSRDDFSGNRRVPDPRWHISAAGEDDVPEWRHLVEIAHKLRPGVNFVLGVPVESWWMNIHPHCLHLWETKDESLVEQWRFEARGHRPT